MLRLLLTLAVECALIISLSSGVAEGARKKKPWPDVNLSTLPSVVGAANSWDFEINERSPVYLADLDKMYVTLAYGWGESSNNLQGRDPNLDQYGYGFYNTTFEHSINNFDFST
jgi:hypothetical protein